MDSSRSERLIYLLDVDRNRSLRCEFLLTRLLNWKSFQPAPIARIQDLMQAKYKNYLRDEDRRLLPRLMYWENPDEPAAAVSGADAHDLLREIIATGRAFLRNGNHLRLQWGEERRARPRWLEEKKKWTPQLVSSPEAPLIAAEPPCYCDPKENVAGTVRSTFSPGLAKGWLSASVMTEEQARAFCLRLLNRFPGEEIPLPGPNGAAGTEKVLPRTCLRVFRRESARPLEKGRAYSFHQLALVEVRFAYGPRKIDWNAEAETVAFEEEGRVRRCSRDRPAEDEALGHLRALGFTPAAAAGNGLLDFNAGHFELPADAPASWADLLDKEFPRLRRELRWQVAFDQDVRPLSPAKTAWFSRIGQTHPHWFSFEAGIRYRGKNIPVLPIVRALLRENRHLSRDELVAHCRRSSYAVPLEGEKFLLLPGDRIANLVKLLFEVRFGRNGNDALRIGAWRAAELADEGMARVEENELVKRLRRLRRETAGESQLSPLEDLPDLPIAPRVYQREGLAWLDFLRDYQLGGILADDMGLGKTMQVLIHILREKEKDRLHGPCLVVAPTSVLDSWEAEQATFTPRLRLLRHHGADRATTGDAFDGFDVVLASYNLARMDAGLFRQVDWHLLVLDEAQRIKNSDAETTRALCSFASHRRLCLTGTPLENHLGELWSLFDFLMPGYLGNQSDFNEDFRKPVEGDDAEDARETAGFLARRLRPFILRRKKDQVARELPPRTEITRLVPLAPRQSELYGSIRLRLHHDLAAELEKRGLAASRIQILDALLKLRQICCDPRLHPAGAKALAASDSAKLAFLMEMLGNLLDEGRTVLIFSQFVRMLKLIASELEAREWKWLELTGQTADRGRVVEAFQAGEAPIFLISLKAGGTGLNLTAADTVIQYDPWWNPAAEQQAADRVYRIGQDKPVFHYRLIAKGTVEEKILHLQQRKQAIVDSILEGLPASQTLLDAETVEAIFGQEEALQQSKT